MKGARTSWCCPALEQLAASGFFDRADPLIFPLGEVGGISHGGILIHCVFCGVRCTDEPVLRAARACHCEGGLALSDGYKWLRRDGSLWFLLSARGSAIVQRCPRCGRRLPKP